MSDIQQPNVIQHNGFAYYNAADIKAYDPKYFYGTSGGIRKIITKKNIDTSVIHYATHSKRKGWTSDSQDNPSKKAKLLLLESWVAKNVPKMMEDGGDMEGDNREYQEAPDLLHLEDDEKFQDSDGNVVEIETRGERTHKGIYFLAKDVSVVFDIKAFIYDMKKDRSSFTEGDDYVYYNIRVNSRNNEQITKRQLFMTYEGMIKSLYSTRSKKAKGFRRWATETIFTHQMGSREQKEDLGSKLLGCSVDSIRNALKPYSAKLSSIYCFSLGTGETLRDSMKLPATIKDEDIIIKFGYTDDLDRRSSEHLRKYKKIGGVDVRIMEFVYIDPEYLSKAETDMKHFFRAMETPVEYMNEKELIAINPKHLAQIKKQYSLLGMGYQGKCSNMIAKLEKLECQMQIKEEIIRHKETEIELKDEIIRLLKINRGL